MYARTKFYKVILFLSMAVLSGSTIHNKPAVTYTDNSGEKSNITLNVRIRKYVNNYIRENEEELSAVRLRSARPFKLIDAVFSRYGLPKEMKYLAVVESQLKATAVSRVGARGPWQFMAATAQELGLKVDSTTDERTHYYKSTVAAAKYLRDLHREFKDWLLVLAAYNSGPAPVYKAIRKAGSRDFWTLAKYLPAETRGHVKRFIASHYYFEGLSSVAMLTKSACETCTTPVGFATL